jgi:hypothetical protein
MQAAAGLTRLETLVQRWLGWSAKAGLDGGCPIAASLFEYDDIDGPVRAEALALERRWRDLMAQLVREAVERGELRADLDVDQFVWELCGIYLSHHASLRFVKDPASDRHAGIAFDALVERARPAPNAGETPRRQGAEPK